MFVRWACPLVEIGMTAFVSSKMPRKFSMARLLTRGTGKVTRLNHCLYCMLHASAEQVVHVPSRGEPRSPLDTASFHVRVAGLSWQDSTLHGGGSLSKFIRIALTVSARPCCSKVCPHGSSYWILLCAALAGLQGLHVMTEQTIAGEFTPECYNTFLFDLLRFYLTAEKYVTATARTGCIVAKYEVVLFIRGNSVTVRGLISALRWPYPCHSLARHCCKHCGFFDHPVGLPPLLKGLWTRSLMVRSGSIGM